MIGSELKKFIPDFDLGAFQQLQDDTSQEVSFKILSRFRNTLIESSDEIEKGLESINSERIWKACHKIAGNAELLGFIQFGYEARRLSKSLQSISDLYPFSEEIMDFLSDIEVVKVGIEAAFPNFTDYL